MKSYSLISIILLSVQVAAHSNMLTPPPRGNKEWWGYCSRGNNCNGACDAPKSQSPFNSIFNKKTYVKRGDVIPVEWLRQNHPGGFVRIAFVPMEKSDDHTAFDNNVVKYVCYETNCQEDHHEPILGELNGPGFKKCSTTVKVPNNLPDGPVSIQWTWFGGGVFFADQRAAFANYINCSDMMVQGGEPYNPAKVKADFQGGDVAYKGNDKCRYWSTNSVFGCPKGAEDNNKNGCGYGEIKYGAPAEWLKDNGNQQQTPASNPGPSATPKPTNSPVPNNSTPSVITESHKPTSTNEVNNVQPTKEQEGQKDDIAVKDPVKSGDSNLVSPIKKKCKPKNY